MKNNAELREKSVKELTEEVLKLRKQQFTMRLKKANGTLDKPHQLAEIRRSIARIKTIMTQKAGKCDVNS